MNEEEQQQVCWFLKSTSYQMNLIGNECGKKEG